jgi:transcriptional regulator with XRE-family HTH domain
MSIQQQMMAPPSGGDPRLEFDLADRLRRSLRVSGVSVQEMAEYLDVTRGTVSNWINGHIVPNTQSLRLFAMKTGIPFEWLRDGEVHPLGLEPRTHCLSVDGEPRGELVSLDVARAARRPGTVGDAA